MGMLGLAIVIGALAAPAAAINFSGTWTMQVSERPDRTITRTLLLNQVGSQLSGSLTSAARASSGSPASTEIYGGKVTGDTIRFYVWVGSDEPVKMVFSGRMIDDAIRFTVTGSPVRYDVKGKPLEPPAPQEVTARRTK
jgi:hypothetical protein